MNSIIYEKAKRLDGSLKKTIMALWEDMRKNIFTDNDSLSEFRDKNFDGLGDYHFGLGLYLRNNILSSDSELYLKFIESGINRRDDMSSLIISLWHISLQ